jgi:hypothetical protein
MLIFLRGAWMIEKSTRLDAINFAQHGRFSARGERKNRGGNGALTIST